MAVLYCELAVTPIKRGSESSLSPMCDQGNMSLNGPISTGQTSSTPGHHENGLKDL